jgi:hypothetical protein
MGNQAHQKTFVLRDGVIAETPEEWVLASLRYALQLLAASAADQLAHYQVADGLICKEDEMALDFDNFSKSVHTYWTLTEEQNASLQELAYFLDSLGGQANATFWTDEALVADPLWDQVRALAEVALAAFDWPKETPPPMEIVP